MEKRKYEGYIIIYDHRLTSNGIARVSGESARDARNLLWETMSKKYKEHKLRRKNINFVMTKPTGEKHLERKVIHYGSQ